MRVALGATRSAICRLVLKEKGIWKEPEAASFASDLNYFNLEPCLSADGKKIIFLSNRPPRGQQAKPGWQHQNLWASDRREDGSWGEPYDLGPPINCVHLRVHSGGIGLEPTSVRVTV